MQAFRLYGDRDGRLEDVPIPTAGPDQVRVKVAAVGVCGSDVHALEAAGRFGYPMPYTLGHETVGWVDTLGEGVSGFEPGLPVALFPLIPCGRCTNCAQGRANLCRTRFPVSLGAGLDGGMAEYVVAPARNLVPLGDLDPIVAAPLTDAGMTSHNAVAQVRDRLVEGSVCVAIGIGGLGHVALQVLRATTPARVIAVDTEPERLAYARALGAWETVEAGPDAQKRIAELCDGLRADVVLDFVGSSETVDLACGSVAAGGKLVMVGLGDGVVPVRLGGALPPQVDVVVPLAGSKADLEAVLDLARRGLVEAKVTAFGLGDVLEVIDRVHRGEVMGRAVLIPDPPSSPHAATP
jgi:propanol-preferring alcohol dehydrogenase